MRSLRKRAIWTAVAWAVLTSAIGITALITFFYGEAQTRFDRQLTARHLQLVVALANSGGDPELVQNYVTDPEYVRPYSGRYWQLTGPDGEIYTSRSLFDAILPEAEAAGADLSFWTGPGPDGEVHGAHQQVRLEDDSAWVVSVAESMAALREEQLRIGQSLLTAFAMVGVLGVMGAVLLLSGALRPLAKLREDVAHRWDAGQALDPGDYPEEVAPLVRDINLLLERNRKVLEGARRQAADLAHALKTPTAILRNEVERLGARRKGGPGPADEALDRIEAQITRSLARSRAGSSAAESFRTDLGASAERLARLFRRMPGAEELALEVAVEPGLTVPVDRQDIEEVLGNLLENALKWRKRSVRLAARRDGGTVVIEIDDDGPGIPEAQRAEALRSGVRLDASAPGSGLGLAIAEDLVSAYDGTIELGTAPGLGGLRATLRLPATRGLLGEAAEEA
jgi:signal transduction histidine kinase